MSNTRNNNNIKNFNQKGFTKNFLALMNAREKQADCCTDWLTEVLTLDSSSIHFTGNGDAPLSADIIISSQAGNILTVLTDGLYATGGGGGTVTGADNGLSLFGTIVELGGPLIKDTVIDMTVPHSLLFQTIPDGIVSITSLPDLTLHFAISTGPDVGPNQTSFDVTPTGIFGTTQGPIDSSLVYIEPSFINFTSPLFIHQGPVQIIDGSEGTIGDVFISTDIFGSGHWGPIPVSSIGGNIIHTEPDGLYASGLTAADIIEDSRPKQQTLIDQSVILFDYSIASTGILNSLNDNRTISLFDLEVPSFVLIKINQTVPGKIIILPGRKDSDFAFSPSGTTLLSGFWDGIEWLWTSDIFAPPPTVVSMNTSSTTTIVVVLSEAVTSTGTGWSFLKNGSPLLVSGFSGSGTNTLTFTVATMAQGDNLTASYDSTIGDTIDGSNVSLVSFTNSVVTNNIAGDPDASAFIAALAANGATQDSTHQGYIQTLFTGLKTDGLFTKLYALYIPIFGSAAANKFNVLNSIDSDGAFRLTFTGGFTYSSNGMNGDGLTGFANTHFNPSTNATINNIGIGVYSRVNGSAKTVVVGNYDGTNILSLQLATTPAANVTLNCTLSSNIAVSTVVTRLVYMQRNGSGGVIDVWRDGTELGPLSQGSTFVVNQPLYLSAINQSGSAAFFGDIPMSMILITDGSLSNTDAVNLTNRINTFLTNWGINV